MRLLPALGVVGMVVGALALPASADIFDERVEESRGASFHGEQLVTCTTPDGTVTGLYRISQHDGMLVVAGSDEPVAVDLTEPSAGQPGVSADDIDDPTRRRIELRRVTFLERPAVRLAVSVDDVLRLTAVFDQTSGAVLRTISHDEDGSVYCDARLLDFSDGPDRQLASAVAETATTFAEVDPDATTPAEVAGFQRLGTFEVDGEQTVSYYSDGLFSFALLRADRRLDPGGMELLAIEDGSVLRAFTPGQAFYLWEAETGGYALLGDMPLDLQDEVRQGLPRPATSGVFTRLWDRLFGE